MYYTHTYVISYIIRSGGLADVIIRSSVFVGLLEKLSLSQKSFSIDYPPHYSRLTCLTFCHNSQAPHHLLPSPIPPLILSQLLKTHSRNLTPRLSPCLEQGITKASSNLERPIISLKMSKCFGSDEGRLDTGTLLGSIAICTFLNAPTEFINLSNRSLEHQYPNCAAGSMRPPKSNSLCCYF